MQLFLQVPCVVLCESNFCDIVTLSLHDDIRDMASCETIPGQLVSGGCDHLLKIVDLGRADTPLVLAVDADDAIGSVDRSVISGGNIVTYTTDLGEFGVIDVRVPTVASRKIHEGISSHRSFDEHTIVFGSFDGRIASMDMRFRYDVLRIHSYTSTVIVPCCRSYKQKLQ
jgi:hypothetical protein